MACCSWTPNWGAAPAPKRPVDGPTPAPGGGHRPRVLPVLSGETLRGRLCQGGVALHDA